MDDSNNEYTSGDQEDQAESLITHAYFYLAQVEGCKCNCQYTLKVQIKVEKNFDDKKCLEI